MNGYRRPIQKPNKMLGVIQQWTSIPSRGSSNTPSCFMLGTLWWTGIPSRGRSNAPSLFMLGTLWWTSLPSRGRSIQIIPVASCYRNWVILPVLWAACGASATWPMYWWISISTSPYEKSSAILLPEVSQYVVHWHLPARYDWQPRWKQNKECVY